MNLLFLIKSIFPQEIRAQAEQIREVKYIRMIKGWRYYNKLHLEPFLMWSTEGNLMKYSNFTSNMILNQHCVLGKERDLLPVCLVKDSFIPLNLKRVCLEMTWARLIIYISMKCEKHRKPVWPELGQNPNQSHANHNNI